MIRNIILFLISILYGGINFYIGNTVNKGIKNLLSIDTTLIIIIVFSLGTFSTLATYLLTSRNVGNMVGKVGTYWLGFSILAFFIIIITSLVGKLLFKGEVTPEYMMLAQVIIFCVVFFYGIYHANEIKVANYSIKIEKESALENLNIVLISDLHLGYLNDNDKLKKAVDKINEQNPDVVLIAGDFFDGNFLALQSSNETKEILNNINTKYGTYLSLGNHDAGETFNDMEKFINDTEVILLDDKVVKVENKFVIVGRKDPYPIGFQGESKRKESYELQEENLPQIILEHQLTDLEEYHNKGDLILSGHTHKGQIFPFNIVTKLLYEVDYGYHKFDSRLQAIVTSGLGTWGPPLRIGTDNEIVKINISFN